MSNRKLSLVVFGEAGAGKSWLADTAPGPRLIFDVEGGTRFTPSRKIYWDPKGPPPEFGPDDSLVVPVTSYKTMQDAAQWLFTGQLKVNSVIVDSLSEAQLRAKDTILGGTGQMQIQDYGTLLTKVDGLVRAIRDLTNPEPGKPEIDVAVFVAGVRERGKDHTALRPMLVGQMADWLAYRVDVQAYLDVALAEGGELMHNMQCAPVGGVAAKDRTGKLGAGVEDPTIPMILNLIYGPPVQEEGNE